MGTTIFSLFLYIANLILGIANAVITDTKGEKICWSACSVLWGLCVVLKVMKLIGII